MVTGFSPVFARVVARRLRARMACCCVLAPLIAAAPCALAAEDEGLRGPDVTIIAEEERVIQEFRQGGELRMVLVVPSFGKPYYLVPRDPTRGFGDLERADMLVPSWVIVEF
jgi:hypothetical protein